MMGDRAVHLCTVREPCAAGWKRYQPSSTRCGCSHSVRGLGHRGTNRCQWVLVARVTAKKVVRARPVSCQYGDDV